jgi:hypothetical protein
MRKSEAVFSPLRAISKIRGQKRGAFRKCLPISPGLPPSPSLRRTRRRTNTSDNSDFAESRRRPSRSSRSSCYTPPVRAGVLGSAERPGFSSAASAKSAVKNGERSGNALGRRAHVRVRGKQPRLHRNFLIHVHPRPSVVEPRGAIRKTRRRSRPPTVCRPGPRRHYGKPPRVHRAWSGAS